MFRQLLVALMLMSTQIFAANGVNLAVNSMHSVSDSNSNLKQKKCCKHGHRGKRGLRGPQGLNGQNGQNGLQGPTGPTGSAGSPAPGSIIPFTSGSWGISMDLDTSSSTRHGTVTAFGTAVHLVSPITTALGSSITFDENGNDGYWAFSMPRDGILTSVSAFIFTENDLDFISGDITIRAQVWVSLPAGSPPAVSRTFVPLDNAFVDLSLSAVALAGTTANNININLAEFLPAQTQVIMVFSINDTSSPVNPIFIVGDGGAGITIQ